jgi:Arc/MetJ family transcription regulator
MRTTIDVPEKLLRDVTAAAGVKRRNEAVELALTEFVRRRKRQKLLALRGELDVADVSEELERAELAADRLVRRR